MRNIYYILLLFLVFLGCSQKNTEKLEDNTSVDSLATYFTLANDLSLSVAKRQGYNDKAFEILEGQENDSLHRVNLFKVANRYYNLSNWVAFNKTVHLVLDSSKKVSDTTNTAKAYTYLGDYYESQAVMDSAFLYYFRAEKMYGQLGDNFNLAKININKATLQYKESDFLGSEKAVFNALRAIKEEKKANSILYDAYNLLGLIYNELGEHENAMTYHNKALKVIDDEVLPVEYQSKATSFNNIGFLYLNLENYPLAKKYFQKALEQKNLLIHKPPLYAMLLDNLAYSRFKLKESKGLPDLFYESLKMRDSLKLMSGIFINKIHLGEYFASKKDMHKAIEYTNEALALSRSSENYRNVLVALKQLAVMEPKKSSVYAKEYIQINENLQKRERKMGEKFSRIEYETNEIKDENTDLAAKNRNLLLGFGAFGLLGVFSFVIKAQKARNRELLLKQEQQKANEEIYNLMISQQSAIETNRIVEKKRVAQELHDGVLGRMFGVRINLDSLNKIYDEAAAQQRNNYLSELKKIEQDIREISHDLNREKSELINNFVAIVDNLFEEQKKTFQSKLISIIDPTIKWELLSNAVKINLYRIVQESLQNSNKYANANTIRVEFKKRESELFLIISDDGQGFNVNRAKKGIGLLNIKSRTKDCEGIIDIKSKKGEGTVITISIPLEKKQILVEE